MKLIQNLGLSLFIIALAIFTMMLGLDKYTLSADTISIDNDYHREAFLNAAREQSLLDKEYSSSFVFGADFKSLLKSAQQELNTRAETSGIPEGVDDEWNFKLGDWKFKEYLLATIRQSSSGPVTDHPMLFWWLTVGLGIFGGLLFILPKFVKIPGIKHDHIYHSPMMRGLALNWRAIFLGGTITGIIVYGIFYSGHWFWPLITTIVMGLICRLVFYRENSREHTPARSASPGRGMNTAWLGMITGLYLIGFYVLLYWAPQHLTPWMRMSDPLSRALNGGLASQWFVYGMLYTIIILVMGIRMIAKYMHNRYQIIRTFSVMFFQTAFAFLIPEILVRLNQPYFDFKNIWPLNYDFFFSYKLNEFTSSGALGIFMLVWGILLIIVAVPLFTYFYGKRWYCSWVCGCGGLAETLGDPYRQLSDKSLRAWKFERWIVHGVLVLAVVMTAGVLYTYFTGNYQILFINSDSLRSWYGFLIGSAFAGVVGTGFYPLMGNRMWCRFGCPLAAYLGLVQRFRSRFRITTNGGQCISCGNCSTYCEMGIDVRHYAQRGQDVVRASCVGCGVCAAVCPRGVLRLENSSLDVNTRTEELRTVRIEGDSVFIEM
jgi:polyferredoxin